jgi:hypothetical protein
MLWKKLDGNQYKYVAVTEIRERAGSSGSSRTFVLLLADGTTEDAVFEDADRRKWQESIAKGGFVINP